MVIFDTCFCDINNKIFYLFIDSLARFYLHDCTNVWHDVCSVDKYVNKLNELLLKYICTIKQI